MLISPSVIDEQLTAVFRKGREMGIEFEAELMRVYPSFPRRNVPRTPEHYLPRMSPDLMSLMEAHS